eukprot:TRINITY_DN16848_c0_g1_i7.p1 TRINITY_DN16848_c0_g1~~TRINITY_DN16848_c0_g1_i7.p1  ORF type:complete len:220 (+),score=38.98 TRINITY_DN16848_c0_g1_i7:60-662(+)
MQDVTHLAMASELTAGKELQHTVQYDMLSALTTTKSDKPETTALQMKLSGLEGLPRHTLAQQRQIRELRQRIGYALARERKEKESGAKKSGSRSGERRGRDRRDRKSSRRRSLTPERRRRRDRSYDSYDDSDRDRDRDRRYSNRRRDYSRDHDRNYKGRSRRYSRSLSSEDRTPPRRERQRSPSSSSEHFEAPAATSKTD